jgi:molybdopterin-guanine dinucleotide biosynthesis protein A
VNGVLGAVLAGGASRRLGRDKAAVTVGGVSMIERAVGTLAAVCDEVVVVSARADTPVGGWRIVPDLRKSVGPLGGLETSLAWADERGAPAVFVLACDLPLVDEGVVRAVLEGCRRHLPPTSASGSTAGRACAASRDGRPDFEPLCALYSTPCLGVATRLLDEGAREARALFQAVDGLRVDVPSGAARTEHSALLNVNTEHDLERADALITTPRGDAP